MAPEVVIGTMTEVEPHRLLAFDVTPADGRGDLVRVELADGTGHGARTTLTVTGTDPGERDATAEMWARAQSGTWPTWPRPGRWSSRSAPDPTA